jgi:hypothetical protein
MIVNVYVLSTDTSQAVQLHNHTSLLIRPDQPCDALYMGTTDYLLIPLPCMPVCTANVRCMYYAIIH